MTHRSWIILGVATACAPEPTDQPIDTSVPTSERALTLEVGAGFGAQNFSCRASVPDVGATGLTVRPTDLRLFVHGLTFVLPSGDEAPWTLDSNDWQANGVAFIDHEDGVEACADGTTATNTTVTGTVELPDALERATLRFFLGLPFDVSKLPLATAPTALADADVFISTTQGRARFQLDLVPQGGPAAWPVRILATGCPPGSDDTQASCTSENIAAVEVPNVDLANPAVRMDLQALLADINLSANAAAVQPGGGVIETPLGCQSTLTDTDCQQVFESYGLGSTTPAWWTVAPGQ